MGELRLYAIGINEVRGILGAPPAEAERLRAIARQAFAPEPVAQRGGLLKRIGPIFKRDLDAPVLTATQPVPQDVETLLAGAYVPPERAGASWRALEALVQGSAWGSTRLELNPQALDDLDFALALGGVSAAVGIRHLLNSATQVNLLPVDGLTVGYHPYALVLTMADAYRGALGQVKTEEQQATLAALVAWLDGFVPWAQVAASLGRPVPDLVGFWAS